ncbi:MAG: hypothetical protein ACFFDT_09665, partial [Candidatus Hodarchaeota archaeon]
MNTPLEICIKIVASTQTKIQSEMPDIHTWPILKTNSVLESVIHLMVGIDGPPAICQIAIGCSIPEGYFDERMVSLQVSSSGWLGEVLHIPEKELISEMIQEEYERKFVFNKEKAVERGLSYKDVAPLIIIENLFRHVPEINQVIEKAGIEIKFSEIFSDLKMENGEIYFDEVPFSNAIYEDVVSLRRIYERLKQLARTR